MKQLWCIENEDEVGEGMVCLLAETEEEARTLAQIREPQAKITSCEAVLWVSLALVTGKLGEHYYFERGRGSGR